MSSFKSEIPVEILEVDHSAKLNIFSQNIDPLDYYLIGVDTARSLKGAYNAIEVYSFKNFNQIAELSVRLGSFNKYGDIIHSVFQWLYSKVGNRIILCIEKNTIGLAPIEHLTDTIKTFNYRPFLFSDNDKEPGLMTTGISKDMMIGCFKEILNDNPTCIKSQNLISQLSSIERRSSGSIGSEHFSDLFMATCFCAYTRKRKAMDIMPLLLYTNDQIETNHSNLMKDIISLSNPRNGSSNMKGLSQDQSIFVTTPEKDANYICYDLDDTISFF